MPTAPTQTETHSGGDIVERHRHDDHQLIYVSSGVIAIGTARGSWVAAADRALWIPARVWHEHRFYGRTSFHTLGFPGDATPLPADTPAVVAIDPLLRELIIASTGPGLEEAEADRVTAVLRDRLGRAAAQPFLLPSARDPRLVDACRLVEADLALPRTIVQLAREVGTSERTLSRLFRAEFGMSYPQWRTRARILKAMVLLAEGATVTETAHACGWATTSAFVSTFTRTVAVTPGTHRARATRRPSTA